MEERAERRSMKVQFVAVLKVVAWTISAFVLGYAFTIGGISLLKLISPTYFGVSQNVLIVAVSTLLYVMMLAVLLLVPRIRRKTFPSLTILGMQRSLSWKDIGLALPAIIVYFISTTVALLAASRFLPWIDAEQAQEIGFSASPVGLELVAIFLLLVVVGPFIEELIFRGYLYGKIRSIRIPFWLTALIVSVLFGLAHMQWNVGIDTFVLSMVMCIMRELTGSIWTGVAMHMMKNGLAFYFLFIATDLLPTSGALIF